MTTTAGIYGTGLYDVAVYGVPRALVPFSEPGAYGITTELWRADRFGTLLERIDPDLLGAGDVVFNEDAAPKRTFTMQVHDPYAFTPFRDWLVPVVGISDPEGNHVTARQGLYLVTPSPTTATPGDVTGTLAGRDGTQLLLMATRDDAVLPAGQDRGAFCRDMVLSVGFDVTQVLIPDLGVIQDHDWVWDPGTSVAAIVGDVLTASNHYAPWADANGRIVTAPYRPLTDVAPVWTYTNANDDDAADLEGQITEEPDWSRLANVVTVRKLGYGDTPTISYTARNTHPDSPVSIPRLGFEWGGAQPVVDDPELVDEAAAKVRAETLLSERASHYRKLTVQTFPTLRADAHQTVGLEIWHGARQTYAGRFWRTGWTLHLDGANTTMQHHLARVEEWRT